MAIVQVPITGLLDDVTGRLVGVSSVASPGINFPEGPPKPRLFGFAPVSRNTLANSPSAASAGLGARAIVTNLGAYDVDLVSDGTNWRPVNGEALIRHANGTVAAPVASLAMTGAAALVTLPADIALPAKLLLPNSRIRVEAEFARSGTTGNMTVSAHLGNAKTTADPLLGTEDFTTTQTSLWVEFIARFGSSVNSYYTATGSQRRGSGSAAPFADRTIVGANQAFVSFGVTAGSVGDTLRLIGYRVTQEV